MGLPTRVVRAYVDQAEVYLSISNLEDQMSPLSPEPGKLALMATRLVKCWVKLSLALLLTFSSNFLSLATSHKNCGREKT